VAALVPETARPVAVVPRREGTSGRLRSRICGSAAPGSPAHYYTRRKIHRDFAGVVSSLKGKGGKKPAFALSSSTLKKKGRDPPSPRR